MDLLEGIIESWKDEIPTRPGWPKVGETSVRADEEEGCVEKEGPARRD